MEESDYPAGPDEQLDQVYRDSAGRELEEELVRTTMANCKGVKARAARQLGIPRSTLYHLLERYGL